MNKPGMLKVAPTPTEQERIDRLQREAIEHINRRLTDEIAPALRAEIVAEVKGTIDDARRIAWDHGHSVAMSKMWRAYLIGAVLGFFGCAMMYGVAATQGAALARAHDQNAEIRQELDNR